MKIALIFELIDTNKSMEDLKQYQEQLAQALEARDIWLEKTQMGKLKDEFRTYHSAYATIYDILLKKGAIHSDPYKQEAKMGEIQVLPADDIPEPDRINEISIRLSNYDNQLDFLVNFYSFNAEFLTLERIKRISTLVKYINWSNQNSSSVNANTRVVLAILNEIKSGTDTMSISMINESQVRLVKSAGAIMQILKIVMDYQKERYKRDVQVKITNGLSINFDNAYARKTEISNQIKKHFHSAMAGIPFYTELVEELIKELDPKDGPPLRAAVLKSLEVPENKTAKKQEVISYKPFLIDGLRSLGGSALSLTEILRKFNDNNEMFAHVKKTLGQRIRELIREMLNKEPDPVMYDIQYVDAARGTTVKDKINFIHLQQDLERRIRVLGAFSVRSASGSKLDAMGEDQLLDFLNKNLKDLQSIHKSLTALDDCFKLTAPPEIKDKIKGVKPELSTIKNVIIAANQKRFEYSSLKEEEEQLKRIGIS
jgi:hypothetical protein